MTARAYVHATSIEWRHDFGCRLALLSCSSGVRRPRAAGIATPGRTATRTNRRTIILSPHAHRAVCVRQSPRFSQLDPLCASFRPGRASAAPLESSVELRRFAEVCGARDRFINAGDRSHTLTPPPPCLPRLRASCRRHQRALPLLRIYAFCRRGRSRTPLMRRTAPTPVVRARPAAQAPQLVQRATRASTAVLRKEQGAASVKRDTSRRPRFARRRARRCAPPDRAPQTRLTTWLRVAA